MEQIKILDHGYIAKIEKWGSDEAIIEAARMSTGKGFLGWGSPLCSKCGGHPVPASGGYGSCPASGNEGQDPFVPCIVKPEGDEKLLRFLWENKHHTPFEMAGLTIEVKAPIFVFREWHRHRVPFSYNEMSARYTPLPDENYVPSIERLMIGSDGKNKQAGTVGGAAVLTLNAAEFFQRELRRVYDEAETVYQEALLAGVPKELARVHLPVGRYSRMRASSNLRGWLNFLALRSDKNPGAQWEIRCYANALHDLLEVAFPRTLALFNER